MLSITSRISVLIVLMLRCQLATALPQPGQQSEAIEEDNWHMCPTGCVCQYDSFHKLSIAHWVNYMTSSDGTASTYVQDDADYLMSSRIKLATCLLQQESETLALLSDLPMDLQALVLLHTGSRDSPLAVNTSSLRPLSQLHTLEIRATGGITLIIDEPLELLQYANFEQIRLQASERLERPHHSKLPSDDYEYKPPSDVTGNEVTPKYPLQFEPDVAVEIMSYEQHVERLKQTRMPSFWGWNQLEVLRIQSCQLNELHWQMFDGLTQLHHLSLERNGIAELPPFAFSGAPQLRSLSLAHNGLTRLYYLGLAGLLQLEKLNLADNRLERLSESSFPPLPRLLKADLRENPIMYILPATFWVMNETQELQLGSKQAALELRSWHSYGQFDSLNKLRTLSLGNVSAPSLEQGVFKGLHALEKLTLRGSIGSVQFDVFAGMEKLRELDLSHCGISELSMDALLGVNSLELLNLAHNNLKHIPNGLLDEQPNLEVIQLEGNQLSTLPTRFFLQPRLRAVRLDQNPWQCGCEMSNWLPRLTNVVRGRSVESCVRDVNGEPMLCRHVASYEMDKTLVPRCANYNGRSVYYVLRRQLHCRATPILTSSKGGGSGTRTLPHWRKVELLLQQQRHNKIDHKKKTQAHRAPLGQRNSLDYIWRQQQQQQQQQQHRNEAFELGSDEQQMSNEI